VTHTQFNGVEVIGADAGSFYFQVGPNGIRSVDGIVVNTIDVTQAAEFTAMQGTSATVYSPGGTIADMTNNALSLIGRTDSLLQVINTQRAILGAVQNRFESVIRNGENIAEQLSASRSRIQDADFAKETAALTKAQILQQAGTTVLSQANAVPQSVLALLQG
jgi:flagellin